MNNTSAKLSSKDIWELIKYGFTGMIACAFVFVLPYLLLSGAIFTFKSFSGIEPASGWIGYLLGAALLYFVVSNLTDILSSLSRLSADLAIITDGMSFLNKALLVILFLLYVGGWHHFPKITFFVSVLLLIPGGFTYDKYKIIKKEKASSEYDD